jgi:hypothetical protein
LVLPGDSTGSESPDEEAVGSNFVVAAAEALGVPPDHVVFVPGNHDVDWRGLYEDGSLTQSGTEGS